MKNIILNIDCTTDQAFVCLAVDGQLIQSIHCHQQKDHAAFIHPAIAQLLKEQKLTFDQINAIAVGIGPGSYTGLRVALSSAKGICYALKIPLITISSLEVIAWDIIMHNPIKNALICPMIDARRMEVFCAIYDNQLNEQEPVKALILDEKSFEDLLMSHEIIFTGNGSEKFKTICKSNQALFIASEKTAVSISFLSNKYYKDSVFSDLALCEPQYTKDYKAF